jgi:hypothetical protein
MLPVHTEIGVRASSIDLCTPIINCIAIPVSLGVGLKL